EPEERFADAAELVQALRDLPETVPVDADPGTRAIESMVSKLSERLQVTNSLEANLAEAVQSAMSTLRESWPNDARPIDPAVERAVASFLSRLKTLHENARSPSDDVHEQ